VVGTLLAPNIITGLKSAYPQPVKTSVPPWNLFSRIPFEIFLRYRNSITRSGLVKEQGAAYKLEIFSLSRDMGYVPVRLKTIDDIKVKSNQIL